MNWAKLVPHWKEVLKKAWVNHVLYLMFALQIYNVVEKVVQSQPVNIRDVLLTVLAPIGVGLRILSQVAIGISILRLPSTNDIGVANESNKTV